MANSNWPLNLTPLRSEAEITQSWGGALRPLVSVICATYNHEEYIREAIEGFLMQETYFPVEIIIHDDASTDRTVDIIIEFAAKYPTIVRPIIQKENQYSKGNKIVRLVLPDANGQFIALCEGDDYWTDKNKLSRQVEALTKFETSDICFHSAYSRNDVDGQLLGPICVASKRDAIISIDKVIIGGGGYMPTASILFRKKAMSNIGDWFDQHAPVGDYFWQIYGSVRGGAVYINVPMCVYRCHSTSWNAGMINQAKKIDFEKKFITSLLAARAELAELSSSFDEFIFNHYRGLIFEARRKRQKDLCYLGLSIIDENSYVLDSLAKRLWFYLAKNNTACGVLSLIDASNNLISHAYKRLTSPGLLPWLKYRLIERVGKGTKCFRN